MADTVRTADELINSLFATGQVPRSINEQDMRDLVVSISLETADLSSLPRSPAGLARGKLWIDNTNALRVSTALQLPNVVDFTSVRGISSLFAQGLKQGAQAWPGSASLAGAGGLTANATVAGSQGGSATNLGAGGLSGAAVQRMVASGNFAGAGSITGTARQRWLASRTIGGAGSITGNGTVSATALVWASAANITRSNANLTAMNSYSWDLGAGHWAGTTGSSFKSSGKWYVELHFSARSGDMRYGIANPSVNLATYLGVDTNSWGINDQYDGTGQDIYNNTWAGANRCAPPGENSTASIALDCDNWKWWQRTNGGSWCPSGEGTQDPATNQGGLSIPSNLRTGGISFAFTVDFGQDYVDLYPTSTQWLYTAPSGFGQM